MSQKPPEHLSARGKRLWRTIVKGYEMRDHDLELLRLLCEALDRAAQAQEQLTRDGLTITDRWGVVKPHPLVSIRRDAEGMSARLLRELNLSDDAPSEPYARLPRKGSN